MEVEGVDVCDPSEMLRVVGDGVLAINNLSLTPYLGDMTVGLEEGPTVLVSFNFIVFLGGVLKGALLVSVDELVRRSNCVISVRYPASRPESMAESGSGVVCSSYSGVPASGGIDIVAAGAAFYLAAFVCGMV